MKSSYEHGLSKIKELREASSPLILPGEEKFIVGEGWVFTTEIEESIAVPSCEIWDWRIELFPSWARARYFLCADMAVTLTAYGLEKQDGLTLSSGMNHHSWSDSDPMLIRRFERMNYIVLCSKTQ